MSLFLALALPASVRAPISAVIDQGRQHPGLDARWLRPERLHLTVLFFGRPLAPDALAARMPALAARHAPPRLGVAGAGLFETPRAAGVLWLGLSGDLRALSALRTDALNVYADAVEPAELDRPYRPHLTLARAKRPGALDDLAEALVAFAVPECHFGALHLYESRGDQFTSLHAEPLGGALEGDTEAA